MKKRVIMFLVATIISVSMININSISAKAITQDEMAAMVREQCEKDGIDYNSLDSTGGTNKSNISAQDQKKADEKMNKVVNEISEPQPTKAPEPTKEVEEPKTEVVETEVELIIEEPTTTEEMTTTEEETTTEEITTTEEPTTIEELTTTEEETTTVEVEEPTKKMNIAVFVIIFIVVVIGLAVFGILHKKYDKH